MEQNSLMNQLALENALSASMNRVNQLVDSLQNAEFIRSHELYLLTLEELGDRLFAAKEEELLSTPESLATGSLDPALEKCIHDYCLLLQELEQWNMAEMANQTLSEIRDRETRTRFVQSTKSEGHESQPSTTGVEPPQTSLDSSNADHSNASEQLDWDRPMEPIETVGSTQLKEPEAGPPSVVSNVSDGALDWPSELPIEEAAPAPKEEQWNPEFRLETPTPAEPPTLSFSIPEEKIDLTPIRPEGGTQVLDESDTTLSKWIELPTPNRETPVPVQAVSEEPPVEKTAQHLSPPAEGYWKAANAVWHTELTAMSEHHRTKFAGIALCWAIEKELSERILPGLEANWTERAIPIVTTLDTAHRKFDLHPELKHFMEERAKQHSQFLYEGKIPSSGIINSLRYLLATEELEKFRPSLLDWGVVLYWFGTDTERNGVKFSNLLQLEPVHEERLTEMVFRLFRMNKFRMKALSVQQHFDSQDLQSLKQDAERVAELLAPIQQRREWTGDQVA